MSHQTCPTHPNQHISFICTHKDCKVCLCSDCLLQHCKAHEEKKTFPELTSTEAYRHDLCDRISDILKTFNQEIEDMRLSPGDKIIRSLDAAEEEVLNLVKEYFKEKKKQALDELQSLQESSALDSNLQVSSKLQEKISEYEKLKSSINHSHGDIKLLEDLMKRELDVELNQALEEVNPQTHPLRLWKSDDFQSRIKELLSQSFVPTKNFTLVDFPPHLRHHDFEVILGDSIIIRKKGNFLGASDCLGVPFTKGIHSFSTRIDSLEQSPTGGNVGWLCMGVISTDLAALNFGTNNYYSSISISSDGSTYGLTMSPGGQVAVGVTYDFEVNLETGVIKVTGPDGFGFQAEGHQGKVFYPFFESSSKHQATFFNYRRVK